VPVLDDTVSNPDDKKFFSDELKEVLREASDFTAVSTVVTTVASASTFFSGLTTPVDSGAYVFVSFLLLPTLTTWVTKYSD
jgi:hypothetical protein